MKTQFLGALLVSVVALGCGKDQGPADGPGEKATPASSGEPAANEVKVPEIPPPSAPGPAAVLESVFAAARADDAKATAGLCDPKGENDGDTRDICNPGDKWDDFKKYFAEGKVVGEARVSGDDAQVDFMFGPGATKQETMNLVRRDGKWYLMSF